MICRFSGQRFKNIRLTQTNHHIMSSSIRTFSPIFASCHTELIYVAFTNSRFLLGAASLPADAWGASLGDTSLNDVLEVTAELERQNSLATCGWDEICFCSSLCIRRPMGPRPSMGLHDDPWDCQFGLPSQQDPRTQPPRTAVLKACIWQSQTGRVWGTGNTLLALQLGLSMVFLDLQGEQLRTGKKKPFSFVRAQILRVRSFSWGFLCTIPVPWMV